MKRLFDFKGNLANERCRKSLNHNISVCHTQKVFIKSALEGGEYYEAVCHSVNTARVVEEDTFLEIWKLR